MPYPAINSMFDELVARGLQNYWKEEFVTSPTRRSSPASSTGCGCQQSTPQCMYPINGACQDIPADATAFGHRDASYACVIAGMWPDPALAARRGCGRTGQTFGMRSRCHQPARPRSTGARSGTGRIGIGNFGDGALRYGELWDDAVRAGTVGQPRFGQPRFGRPRFGGTRSNRSRSSGPRSGWVRSSGMDFRGGTGIRLRRGGWLSGLGPRGGWSAIWAIWRISSKRTGGFR
jgi:hypothetical protein